LLPESLRATNGGGVFFLHGEEEYLKRRAARLLVEKYVDPATREFNFERLEGSETPLPQLASAIATPPMMTEWRVVHGRGAGALAGGAKASARIPGRAKKPPPGLVLILQTTVPPRTRARLYRYLARLARSAEFKAIQPHEVPGWLVTWSREEAGVDLKVGAARVLAGAVGTDLGVLVREVEKLAALVGDGSSVDQDAVAKGGIRIPRQNRWEWFDVVGNRQIPAAVRGLGVLIGQGESPVGLVVGLASHFLRLGVAEEGGERALNAVLPPYQRFLSRRIAGQAGRWNRSDLAQAVRGLRRLDQLLKSSSLPGDLLLEEWLWSLKAGDDKPGRRGDRRERGRRRGGRYERSRGIGAAARR